MNKSFINKLGIAIGCMMTLLLPEKIVASPPNPSLAGVLSIQTPGAFTNATGFGALSQFCVDGQSNVFVGGYFKGALNYGSLNLTNTNSTVKLFAGRVNGAGNPAWLTNSSACLTPVMTVANPNGGAAFLSYFHGPLTNTFAGSTVVSTSDWGALVLELTPTGSVSQSFLLEANGTNILSNTTTNPGPTFAFVSAQYDAAGNLFVGGNFINALSVGGILLTSPYGTNDQQYFVAKLGTNGTVKWAEQGGSVANDELFDLAVDSAGNTFITGIFGGTNVFGSTSNAAPVFDGDGIVLKLDTNGAVLWSQQASAVVGGYSRDFHNVYADGVGGCYVAGAMSSEVDTNGTYPTTYNAFIARLNNSGGVQWSTQLIATNGNIKVQLGGVDTNGNIYAAGDFDQNAVSFGGQFTLSPAGVDDNVFAAKLSSLGSFQWAQQMTAQAIQEFNIDPMGNSFILGAFGNSDTPGNTNLTTRGGTDTFITKLDTTGNYDWTIQIGGQQANWAGNITPDNTGGLYLIGFYSGINYVENTSLPGPGTVASFVTRIVDTPSTNTPSIIIQPQPQTSVGTNTVALQVTALGAGPLTYQWTKNNTNVAAGTESVLWLLTPNRRDSGVYSVSVTNSAGGLVSSNATVKIMVPESLQPPI